MSQDALPSTDTLDQIVESLMTAIEARDYKLRRHSERVAKYAGEVAEALGMDAEIHRVLTYGCLLHDIGNIGIPDSILLKPTGLTAWEFDEMKLHSIIGEQICRPLNSLEEVLPLIRNHHEKLDGSGYPDSLRGADISLPLRILSVTDVYDTLRCERAYRDAFTHEEAVNILHEEAKRGWWDEHIVIRLADLTAPQSDFAPV